MKVVIRQKHYVKTIRTFIGCSGYDEPEYDISHEDRVKNVKYVVFTEAEQDKFNKLMVDSKPLVMQKLRAEVVSAHKEVKDYNDSMDRQFNNDLIKWQVKYDNSVWIVKWCRWINKPAAYDDEYKKKSMDIAIHKIKMKTYNLVLCYNVDFIPELKLSQYKKIMNLIGC